MQKYTYPLNIIYAIKERTRHWNYRVVLLLNLNKYKYLDIKPFLDEIAALCEEPQPISRIRLFRSASIIRGLSSDSLEQWPSFPSSPSPQEKTRPSTVNAMACLPPEWTDTWCKYHLFISDIQNKYD